MNIYVKMQYYPNQECKHIDHHNQEPHKHSIAFIQTQYFFKHTHKPTMMKPATRMISYQNLIIIDEDEETALFLGTTILPQPTTAMTMRRRLSKWRLAIVASMVMMLVVAGGTVWMQDVWYLEYSTGECKQPKPVGNGRGFGYE